jgi:hypothetical protein
MRMEVLGKVLCHKICRLISAMHEPAFDSIFGQPACRIIGEMTDETLKPKRKLRRCITAGALLFMTIAGWWYWPRGDARFVGTWALRYEGEAPRGIKWFLGPNGRAKWYGVVPPRTFQTTWSVDGNVLTVGKGMHPTLNGKGNHLETLLNWIGIHFLDEPFSSEILSISNSQIVLKTDSPTQSLILTRIPE